MQNGTGVRDRYELALSTESRTAADHYVDALDMFIAQTYGVEREFARAVEADEGLAVAHAAMGLLQLYRSAPEEAKKSAEAREGAGGSHDEAGAAAGGGYRPDDQRSQRQGVQADTGASEGVSARHPDGAAGEPGCLSWGAAAREWRISRRSCWRW